MFSILFQFGVAGFVLFLLGFVAFVVVCERFYFFFLKYPATKKDLFLLGLLEILNEHKTLPLQARESLISQEVEKVHSIFAKGLVLIRFISVVAPMLGLFGTILGMIEIFGSIAETNTPVTPSLISSGLKEALYTTAIGLVVAIPSVGFNVFFNNTSEQRLQRYIYHLNQRNIEIDYHD